MIKPNKIRQFLAFGILLASAALMAAIFLHKGESNKPAELLPRLPGNIDVSLQKIHYSETREGVNKWDLVADSAEYDRGADVTRLTGVSFTVAGTAGLGTIIMTADRAEYHNKTKDISLAGNVVAKSGSGFHFTTNRVKYYAARSAIETKDAVRFNDGNLSLQGNGMELSIAARKIRILSNVTADVGSGISK